MTSTARPADVVADDQLATLRDLMPFAAATGVELVAASADEVVGRLGWAPERCTAGGALHGGALMTLADSTGAVCAHLNLPEGAATSTITATTSFLRAVRSGSATAVSRPLHVGRQVIVVRTEVTDDEGRPVAHVTAHQAVLPARAGDSGPAAAVADVGG